MATEAVERQVTNSEAQWPSDEMLSKKGGGNGRRSVHVGVAMEGEGRGAVGRASIGKIARREAKEG
jgi:hypothetical protein